jgi:hypothetical protein
MRVEPDRYGWNQVDTVLIPYGPGSKSAVCVCSINYHPFDSFSPGSNPDRNYECHAVYGKGRYDFTLRVEAGRCSSNRFNTDIDTELEYLQKKLNMTQKVSSPYRSHGILKNWHGLRCRSMQVKPGRYGFDTVWTRFEIWLCVTVAWRTMQYTTTVNAVLHSGLMQVKAVRTGSMGLEPSQYGYKYGIEIHVKIWTWLKLFSQPYCAPRIHQELTPFHIPVTNF